MCPTNESNSQQCAGAAEEKLLWHIPSARYNELLKGLLSKARDFLPPPDCVIGIKRSGLMPAVYLSHQLKLPMLTDSETKSFPAHKFKVPLVVDTTSWNGASLRRIYNRLNCDEIGQIHLLVMFARSSDPPNVPALHYLEKMEHIPRFWYELADDT